MCMAKLHVYTGTVNCTTPKLISLNTQLHQSNRQTFLHLANVSIQNPKSMVTNKCLDILQH